MRNGQRILASFLVLVLFLSVCGNFAPSQAEALSQAPAAASPRRLKSSAKSAIAAAHSSTTPYGEILENCYAVLYADWYMPLTAENIEEMGLCPLMLELDSDERDRFGYALRDLNGDGTDELLLGIDNTVYMDTVWQLFTIRGGTPACLYTLTEGDALYLCRDNTLLQEGMDNEGSMYTLRYALNADNMIDELGGLLCDEGAAGGPCFSLDADGVQTPIAESEYWNIAASFDARKDYFRYTPFNGLYGASASSAQTPAPAPARTDTTASFGGGSGGCYTHELIYDRLTGAPTASVLLPDGWSASLDVNWNNMSTSAPGIATLVLTSPDGRAGIKMISNQDFFDVSANGMHFGEGPDTGLCMTLLHYRNAEEVQPLGLQSEGYGAAVLVRSLSVPDSMRRLVQEAAAVKLERNLGPASTALGCEGTVARNLYRSGNTYIDYLCLVTAAETYISASHVSMDSIAWNIPVTCMLFASSEAAWEQYRDVFDTVVANSGFTADFLFLNIKLGSELADIVHNGLMEQTRQYLQSSSPSWLSEYESSSSYDSDTWANQWSDVIYERNEYQTLDGGAIKVDTAYDSVYQNGDSIYMGPDGLAPDGWTKLEKTY
jgi:hypothetical protein